MANATAVLAAGPAQAVSPRGRFFTNQTFHFETLRNAGYTLSECADLGEMLETTKQITEGDMQSWYAAWAATADRVEALAEHTQDSRSRGGAYMRASTYQRLGEFLLPPDDLKRPASFEKTGRCSSKVLMHSASATSTSEHHMRTDGCVRCISPVLRDRKRNR